VYAPAGEIQLVDGKYVETPGTEGPDAAWWVFGELPAYLDLPSLHSRYWDPLFAACEETGTVIAMHIGSGTRTPQTSADAPGAVGGMIIFGNSVASMTDFLFAGVLNRFPA
jgi:hypothetical protein